MNLRAMLYRLAFDSYSQMKGLQSSQVWQFQEESQWWPSKKLREFQNERLQQLIKHVHQSVPYYRRVMEQAGLYPADIRTTDDLVKFPILRKDDVRGHWHDLISTQIDLRKTSVRTTGGSTGEPLQVMNDYQHGDWEYASFRRGFGFAGWHLGEPLVQIFGGNLGLKPTSFRKRLHSYFAGELQIPAFEINRETVTEYVRVITQHQAQFVHGYCSAIYLLAKFVQETKLELSLQAVFPSSENLYAFQRETFEKTFHCNVFNQYGCGECNSMAFECEDHSGLHVSDELVFLEALQGNERVSEGTMGAVTLTTLHNYAMPLIRYQNGDIIALSQQPCACGRGLSRIAELFGRANDLLMTKDGRLISATFLPSFCVNVDFTGIQQFQIIQETRDTLRLKVIKSPEFVEAHLYPLFEVFHRYLGDIKIEVDYVSTIPATPQEKLKFVISKLGDPLLCK